MHDCFFRDVLHITEEYALVFDLAKRMNSVPSHLETFVNMIPKVERKDQLLQSLRSDLNELESFSKDAVDEATKYQGLYTKCSEENKEMVELRKADALQIQELEAEIAQLRAKAAVKLGPGNDGDEKLQILQQSFDPDKVMQVTQASHDRRGKRMDQAVRHLELSYRFLYRETATLISAVETLRNQVKHHKERAAQWQRWSSGNRVSKSSPSFTDSGTAIPAPPQDKAQANHPEENSTPIGVHKSSSIKEESSPACSDTSSTGSPSIKQESSSSGSDTSSTGSVSDKEEPAMKVGSTSRAKTPISNLALPSVGLQAQRPDEIADSDATSTTSDASETSSDSDMESSVKSEEDEETTIRIKDEPLSPSPLQGQPPDQGTIRSSQDLDEIGNAVTTPKSRKKFTVFEDKASASQQDRPKFKGFQSGERRVFEPKDNNQVNQQNKTPKRGNKRRKTGDSGAAAISTVAEDGEDESPPDKLARVKAETPSKSLSRVPDAYQRLDDLLAPHPQKHSPALNPCLVRTPKHPQSATRRDHDKRMSSLSTKHTPSIGSKRMTVNKTESKGRRSATKRKFGDDSITKDREDWDAIIKSVPMRELPIDCLDLSCFKPNPAKNHGLDYAFNEVVRNHEQRKCLPGCLRADCCGSKFRAMVRAGGVKYEAEKHRALLEDFLGDKKHTIDSMTVDERHNILIEAKARQLANQFGKHRHAYERPRSPPGFWRTDMPSTQELAKDRIEADRMEREKVLDRAREAMRPDGQWKFADEI